MEQKSLNEIFTELVNEFEPELNVIQSYPIEEPKFPCLIMDYQGDTTDWETVDTSGEKYVVAGIVTDIFTTGSNRINQAHDIQVRLNSILSGKYRMGRASQDRTSNFLNKDIRRIRTIYDFKVDGNETIYRR